MKTRDVLTLVECELAPKLKTMKIKELERHAEKILRKLGEPDYKKILALVIRAIPNSEPVRSDKYAEIQTLIRSYVSSSESATNVTDQIERITVILMLIVSKKFRDIHQK